MSNIQHFVYLSTKRNPGYEYGLSTVEDHRPGAKLKAVRIRFRPNPFKDGKFESCLKHNNSENQSKFISIKRYPKYIVLLEKADVDVNTGEISPIKEIHQTDEIKASRRRKIKAVKEFCDFYEPLYKQKIVSLLFLTFTRMNYARMTFSRMLDNIRYHVEKQLKIKIRGFVWVLEASNRNHLHYHLCLAIDRLNAPKMPQELMFESLWGQRTQVRFVVKTIRGYLMKYLSKDHSAVEGMRGYGRSRKFG
jgi:hypothetical protein